MKYLKKFNQDTNFGDEKYNEDISNDDVKYTKRDFYHKEEY